MLKKKNKKIDSWVYKHSQKPNEYVEVHNPPVTYREKKNRPQDARQVQYNNWSKHFKVYSGSYLPRDGKKLLKKGWVDETESNHIGGASSLYRRKSTNQWVRNDYDKEPWHWHWYNWREKEFGTKHFRRNKRGYIYLNKYGEPCTKFDDGHHIENGD